MGRAAPLGALLLCVAARRVAAASMSGSQAGSAVVGKPEGTMASMSGSRAGSAVMGEPERTERHAAAWRCCYVDVGVPGRCGRVGVARGTVRHAEAW